MAYDHPNLQETLILIFYECLYFGAEMQHSLICPNKVWDNGINVDFCPKQYSNGLSLHGINVPKEEITMPFKLHGCIS